MFVVLMFVSNSNCLAFNLLLPVGVRSIGICIVSVEKLVQISSAM